MATGSRMFLSEQFSWTTAHFLHRSECLWKKAGYFELLTQRKLDQQPLSHASLTQQAGNYEYTYKAVLDIQLDYLYL